jgi:putative effector of murein hydrolase
MRVTDPEAQGLAMGACAHAIGTAASAEQGVTQGAFPRWPWWCAAC